MSIKEPLKMGKKRAKARKPILVEDTTKASLGITKNTERENLTSMIKQFTRENSKMEQSQVSECFRPKIQDE
jgi:hypothetical protein